MYLVRCSICRSCSLFGLSQPDDKVGKGIDPRVGKELTLIQSKRFSMKIAAAAILSWEGGVFNRFWWAINQHTSKEHAMGVSFHLCWAPTDQISDFYDLFSFKSRNRWSPENVFFNGLLLFLGGIVRIVVFHWMQGWAGLCAVGTQRGAPNSPIFIFNFEILGGKIDLGGLKFEPN